MLLTLPAGARAGITCDKREALRAQVKSCEDNMIYANAGKICLQRYEMAIAAARTKVASTLQAVASSDQQSKGLENAKKGYSLAIGSLRELVKQGKIFEKEIAEYKNEVVLPDDFGSATEAGLPAEEFLRHQPCYTDTQKLLKQHAKNIGLTAKELELTAEIAEELSKKAFQGEASLKNKDLLPLLDPSKKSKAGADNAAAGNKPKQGASDITGTDKEKKKNK